MDITYCVLDVFLLVLMCMLYANTSLGIIKSNSLKEYRILLLVTAVMLLTDILCRSSYDISSGETLAYCLSCVYYALVSLTGTAWVYLYITNNNITVEKKNALLLMSIPLLIVIILLITSYWTGWILTTDNGIGAFYPVFIIILALPIIISAIHAVYRYAITETNFNKKKYEKTALFFLLPIIGFVLQSVWYDIPFICIGFAIGIAMYHFDMQNETMRSDSESNINNRLTMKRYLQNTFDDRYNGKIEHLFVGFGDLDRFGLIKQRYGKNTTDRIVADLGNVLMNLSTSDFFPGFNDGDEFVFIITSDSYESAKAHIDKVYEKIAEYDSHYEYSVHMSVGLVEYIDQKSVDQLLSDADEESKKVKAKYYSDNGFVKGAK